MISPPLWEDVCGKNVTTPAERLYLSQDCGVSCGDEECVLHAQGKVLAEQVGHLQIPHRVKNHRQTMKCVNTGSQDQKRVKKKKKKKGYWKYSEQDFVQMTWKKWLYWSRAVKNKQKEVKRKEDREQWGINSRALPHARTTAGHCRACYAAACFGYATLVQSKKTRHKEHHTL